MNNEVKLNPEHHDDYFQGGDGEDQVQLPPEKHVDEGEYQWKYSGMQGDLEDKGWKVFLVPYEVSSRGQILKSTKSSIITTLKQFKIKIKAEQSMFKQLSKIALMSTFSIFHAYQTKEWVSPPLLKP